MQRLLAGFDFKDDGAVHIQRTIDQAVAVTDRGGFCSDPRRLLDNLVRGVATEPPSA
jgi:hypothetical protein